MVNHWLEKEILDGNDQALFDMVQRRQLMMAEEEKEILDGNDQALFDMIQQHQWMMETEFSALNEKIAEFLDNGSADSLTENDDEAFFEKLRNLGDDEEEPIQDADRELLLSFVPAKHKKAAVEVLDRMINWAIQETLNAEEYKKVD